MKQMARPTEGKELRSWLQKLETGHNKKIDLGLERIKKVFNRLKINRVAETIITVAGTNGKGSTVAIVDAICRQSGYKTGVFTSPHILYFNERIKINGKNAEDNEIIEAFRNIESNLGDVSLSYFEYATLAAFLIFKRKNVDVAILEVGLGGRLDSVNSVDTDCAIITTIDLDHTSWLGDNIESIGYEKAGIMRPDTPVVFGDDNCPKSIIRHASDIGARLHFRDKNINIKDINLIGDYQLINAQTAITALKLLNKLKINADDIQAALMKVELKGRLQTIDTNPHVIIDVSHNEQAATSLATWLQQNPVQGKTIAVFAVLEDKNPINWLNKFSELIDIWCISQPDSERALPVGKLLKILSDYSKLIISENCIAKAFESAKSMANKNDRILVFGSFYTVSEVLQTYES